MKWLRYFSVFFKGGRKGLALSLGETLKDEFATRNERVFALSLLTLLPATLAVPQLLRRFDFVAENAMHDREEKAEISRLIVGEGEKSVPLVLEYCREAKNLSWPIQILEKTLPREEFVSTLISLLSRSYPEFNDAVIVRNREILVTLKDANDSRILEFLAPHLSSRYPEIREVAEACLASHGGQGAVQS